LVDGIPILYRVDFLDDTNLMDKADGQRVNKQVPSTSFLADKQFLYPYSSISFAGNRMIFVGGSIAREIGSEGFCPYFFQIDQFSDNGFDSDPAKVEMTHAWKFDCSDKYFAVD
jgi:hypothetical protein